MHFKELSMSRHKTTYIISWNFMSRHVVCHDYHGIPTSGSITLTWFQPLSQLLKYVFGLWEYTNLWQWRVLPHHEPSSAWR